MGRLAAFGFFFEEQLGSVEVVEVEIGQVQKAKCWVTTTEAQTGYLATERQIIIGENRKVVMEDLASQIADEIVVNRSSSGFEDHFRRTGYRRHLQIAGVLPC